MQINSALRAHLGAVPIFRACSPKELDRVASAGEVVNVPAGRELVREGSIGRELYVILSGGAEVTRSRQTVASLGPGAYFGELSLIEGTERNATVTARTPMQLVVLGQREFARLLAEVPTLSRTVLVGMGRQLQESGGNGDGAGTGSITVA